ncbi:MAG: ABC transporter ATP-binding protein [Euryarchaeota archaeon]|nr:ABC transporter ATP-binding protein [Euryarchaeota archaeon]
MLEVKEISFSYGDRKIIEDISFIANNGEIIGLLGQNGSGKSTLFKNILVLLKSRTGYSKVDGKKLSELTPSERSKIIAYVPQFMGLVFPITVFDFILIGAKISSYGKNSEEAKKKTSEIIKLFELEDLAFKDMRKMSGGERQRTYIARAFAQNPKVIILDEPTSNLDFKYTNMIMNLLKNIARKGKITILIAIHDLNVASRYCDSFVVLKDGEILIDGKAEEVYQKNIIEKTYGVPADILDYKEQKIVVFV